MNPYMLHEVRKDDTARRYKEAEQSRLAAIATTGSARGDADGSELAVASGVRRWASHRTARWAAAITVCAAVAATLFAVTV